jgi:hypothetical protein
MATCPIHGCTNTLKVGLLMCGRHWRLVPRTLQKDVHRTWKHWMRVPHENRIAYVDAVKAYGVARDAAFAHVNKLESPLCT